MNTEIKDVYSSPEYKRSRKAYVAECTFEYFVSLLVTDAYLSTLLHHMGISDAMVGIISSLISFAFLFQLFAIVAVKRIVNIKRASIIFHFASQLFFMSLFFIPFLPFGKEYKTAIVFACVLLAYFGNYLVTSVIYKWGMSFVDTRKRASFGAGKEMVSLISGMVFVLVMGFVIDKFAADDILEAVGPDMRPFEFTVPIMMDIDKTPLEEPRKPEMKFYIQLPQAVPAFSILRKAVDLSAK